MDQLKGDGVDYAGALLALSSDCPKSRLQSDQIDDDCSLRGPMERIVVRINATSKER
jgi:hypothetical protein